MPKGKEPVPLTPHGDAAVGPFPCGGSETDRRRNIPYIVCDALGLDTSDYSFAYVARWAEGSIDLLRETGERVIVCAKGILSLMEAVVVRPAKLSK